MMGGDEFCAVSRKSSSPDSKTSADIIAACLMEKLAKAVDLVHENGYYLNNVNIGGVIIHGYRRQCGRCAEACGCGDV